MFNFIRNHKIITTIIILIIVSFIGFTIFTAISRIGKQPVQIYLVPRDTRLLVDGQQLQPGTAYLKPGTYKVEATRGGFASYEGDVTIGDPNITDIDIALTPTSDSALEWQEKNMNLYMDYEGRAGERANTEGEEFREQYPIVNSLPYKNFIYSIGYRADPSDPSGNSIIVEIDAITGYRNSAIQQIIDLGYDPTNYKINFRNYESPF